MSGPLLCWGSRQAACRYLCELSTRVSDPAGAAWRRRGGSKGGREAWWLRYSGVRTGLYMYGMGACMLVCYMHVAPPWHILSVQYHECSSTPHAGSKCCTTGVTIMYLPPIGTRGDDGDDLCPYMLSPQTFLHALWSLVQFSLLAWPFRLRCVGAIGNEQLARYPLSKTPSCTPLSDPNPHVCCHTRSGVVRGTWLEHASDGLPAVFLLAPRTRLHNRVGTPAMPSYVLHTHGRLCNALARALPLCRPPPESRF
jgi:hypothetical protein